MKINKDFKNVMDDNTYKLYCDWIKRNKSRPGILWPMAKVEMYCKNKNNLWRKDNFKKKYYSYISRGSKEYALAYKILAFTIYGYGNMSNNDRKRKGLKSLRKE